MIILKQMKVTHPQPGFLEYGKNKMNKKGDDRGLGEKDIPNKVKSMSQFIL